MKDLKLQVAGLYLGPNPKSGLPNGALARADNVVCRMGRAIPRPGAVNPGDNPNYEGKNGSWLQVIPSVAHSANSCFLSGLHAILGENSTDSSRATDLAFFSHSTLGLLSHIRNTTLSATEWSQYTQALPGQANSSPLLLPYTPDADESVTTIGTDVFYKPWSPAAQRIIRVGDKVYAASNRGIVCLHGGTAGIPPYIGAPRASSLFLSIDTTPGFLPPDSACAYSVVWCRKDAAGRIIRGAPSGRHVIRNYPVDTTPVVGGYSGTATRAAGSSTVVVRVDANAGYPFFPYDVGNTVTVTYKNNETAGFTTGTYTITASTTSPRTFSYTDPSANAGANRTTTLPYQVTGQPLSVIVNVNFPAQYNAENNGTTVPGIYFVQVYRSEITSGVFVEPSEDKRLVYETPVSGLASIGPLLEPGFLDSASEAFLGEYIYTAPAVGGADQANIPPPSAMDICEYGGSLFLANTVSRKSAKLNLIGTGAVGVGPGNITVDGVSQNAGGVYSNDQSPSQLILQYASNFADSISGSTWGADHYNYISSWYGGTPDDPSQIGAIYLEAAFLYRPAHAVGTGGKTLITFANPDMWAQGKLGSVEMLADNQPARLYYSKPGEPEHFAAGNYLDVGNPQVPIFRIEKDQNSLFVFKGDGIFRLTGSDGNFSVELFDSTKILISAESVKRVGSYIFCLCSCGVVMLNESGARVVSNKIEYPISSYLSSMAEGVNDVAYGGSSLLDNLYLLQLNPPGFSASTNGAYVYDISSDSWSRWYLPLSSGASTTVPTCFMSDCRGNLMVGSTQPGVANSSSVAIYKSMEGLFQGDGGQPLSMNLWFHPFSGESAEAQKHFRRVELLYSNRALTANNCSFTVSFSVDGQPASTVTIPALGLSAGTETGQDGVTARVISIDVPRAQCRGRSLSIGISASMPAASGIVLDGLNIYYNQSHQNSGQRGG